MLGLILFCGVSAVAAIDGAKLRGVRDCSCDQYGGKHLTRVHIESPIQVIKFVDCDSSGCTSNVPLDTCQCDYTLMTWDHAERRLINSTVYNRDDEEKGWNGQERFQTMVHRYPELTGIYKRNCTKEDIKDIENLGFISHRHEGYPKFYLLDSKTNYSQMMSHPHTVFQPIPLSLNDSVWEELDGKCNTTFATIYMYKMHMEYHFRHFKPVKDAIVQKNGAVVRGTYSHEVTGNEKRRHIHVKPDRPASVATEDYEFIDTVLGCVLVAAIALVLYFTNKVGEKIKTM